MEYVLLLAIVVVFLVFKDRPIMVLEFKDGELVKTKGQVPTGFQTACRDIAHKTPFSGRVKIYKTRFTTKLDFSKNVPNKIKQRIKNVFPHNVPTSKRGKRA
ncbi:DUF3634 domain-containing protein [Photobacterium phosphoreum]|uniref:DUF3634 domain-containing protein n=1 Tax=Photobacterium phosphoreum TaxID=659 RepID=A0A2T3JQ74_PHOPO|nr:DUF3634 family protein [Photobacterium phosphoreum]PSU24618.1 DUF3634 domain-containing protein [Photobacterium phosphoreum]PSU42351.1 DUF3634 domain-containing protein [Photobacterium phosphoreum]PSU51209.1 DUF3634 domain-containing protein [Photobacterium phosphoreum]PSU69726.1 DUF3634 domain-containing protein [Photobacterium phosphoreum]PSW34582.1 DUF3634 domain-containing protein [Photobacterium phosphoreum]